MKRTVRILILFIMMRMSILTLSSQAFSIDILTDKTEVKKDDIVTLIIKSSEKSIATNFNINYDSTMFELVGSKTEGLNVAKKDDIIACIYADIAGIGSDKVQIKFKVKSEVAAINASFSLEGAKFRVVGEEKSYTDSEVKGLTAETTVKFNSPETVEPPPTPSTTDTNPDTNDTTIDKTQSNKGLPKTGTSFIILFVIAIIAILGIILKREEIKLNYIIK